MSSSGQKVQDSSTTTAPTSSSFAKTFQLAVDTGIHTVEGNLAGSRAAQLEKKRQQDLEAFEQRKRQIQKESSSLITSMESKFVGTSTTSEETSFRDRTIGLVSAADFKKAAAAAATTNKNVRGDGLNESSSSTIPEATQTDEREAAARVKEDKKQRKKKLKEKKKMMSTLSFVVDEEGEEEVTPQTSRWKKDDTVDTSFLPDKERDEQAKKERLRLEKEWSEKQELTKQEKLEIVYSYWDGSGHRRTVVCKKGDTIGDFLEQVRKDLCREFRELSSISADALIYIKEDLIIPQDLTFYDLILTKARGKSGPLFHFDVHDDVRVGAIDTRVEKDESHPGKVVERRWYDRNKHIFPASRWEVFDPGKDYGSYTIGDRTQK